MGKEWYRGGGKSSKRGGEEDKENANTPTGCMCAVFQLFDFHQFQFALQQQQQDSFKPNAFLPDEETPIPKGAEAPRNSLELEETSLPSTIKEDDESLNNPMGIQIKTNGGTGPKVIRVAPNDSSSSSFSSFYEVSSSPSTKTPNLVARLMGLDLFPDHNSSPISSSPILGTPNLQGKSHLHHHFRTKQALQSKPTSHRSCRDSDFTGSRSLPETPRISSARRSDVEHRLSLQINKENMSVSEELWLSRVSSLRRRELKTEEESRSPGHHARQIVKQVKESVRRKVGLDITNRVRNRQHTSRDELISQCKSKKLISKALNTKDVDVSSPDKHSSSPSCSTRLKFLEPKNKPIRSTVQSVKDHNTSRQPPKPPFSTSSHVSFLPQNTKASSIKPSSQPLQQQQQRPIKKRKKVAEEKYGPLPARLKKPLQTPYLIVKKQEEPFVHPTTAACRANIPDKKCKKTPFSNDLLPTISVPTLLPVKKDPTPPATKIPQKQALPIGQELKRSSSQLSSCSSQAYKQVATHGLGARDSKLNNEDKSNGGTTTIITTGGETAEHEYISRILRRTGIDRDTPVSFTRWFSPSHPLDPSIFYHLEHFPNTMAATATSSEKYMSLGQLGHRWNRKLLFHLVDEILVEILMPYINIKPWAASSIFIQNSMICHMKGSHLVDMLCTKVRSFPYADCRVLEDIDGLIDKDLLQMKKEQSEVAFGEEGEGIVKEIEKDILDTLIHETAVIILYGEGH